MENLKVFFAVFLVAALLLGCGGQQPAAPAGAGANVQGSGAGASGGAGAGGAGSAGANAGAGGSASGSGSAGASGSGGAAGGAGVSGSGSTGGSAGSSGSGSSGAGGASGSNLAGLGFVELSQLGVPVQCTVQMNGTTTDVKMRGKNFLFEGDTVDAETGTSTHIEMIVQQDAQLGYMRLNSDLKVGPFADCEWLKIDMNQSQETGVSTATSTESQLSDLPPGSFTCSAGVFGDDIFVPAGKVCDYAQILAGLALPSAGTGGYGG